jgi:acyl phosphate:glycerol-3-phosphate acyltransferase
MDMTLFILLAILSFLLGACPFSVWIGRIVLGTDIRRYGDGNPGATNVFRAGSKFWGFFSVLADIVKGMPIILIARFIFGLPQIALYTIALCAILGHAYSPFLSFKGGKALAVTAGTIFAIPLPDMITSFIILMLIGFLFIENDAWIVIFGTAGSLVYLLVNRSDIQEIIFICCIFIIFISKHWWNLQGMPSLSGRLVTWIRSRRRIA